MQTRIGKFELKKRLGQGASGQVYLARDTFSDRNVALKVVDSELLREDGAGEFTRGQFLNEAALAGKLHHPHIVEIYEAAIEETAGYVSMEYVAGGDLTPYTKPGMLLPADDVIQIGFKSCSALDYAFRQGIVHRDIKPANLMIASGTDVKIADFGAALLKTEAQNSSLIVGTPHYMSPEQASGGELSLQSDMYAMGVVLYELLTGRRPFTGADLGDLLRNVMCAEPQKPSSVNDGIATELDDLVLRALCKRPQDRYASWADFALEFAKVGRLSVYQKRIQDSEKFVCFRKASCLSGLNDAQVWELVHASSWQRLPAGTMLLREGEPGKTMYMLAHGQAKATKAGRLLNVISAGECYGEMAWIKGDDSMRHATVQSLTDVLIAEFDTAALDAVSESCQIRFTRALVHTLMERLALADSRLTQTQSSIAA